MVRCLDPEAPMAQHPTNPIPETLESIPGFPDHLQIYRIPASRYWYARCYLDGKRILRSLKTEKHANAVSAAKDLYNELLLKRSQGLPLTEGNSFKLAAQDLMKWDQGRVDRGERKQSLVDDFRYIFEKDLLPFFKKDHPSKIDTKRIEEYVARLQARGVGSKTIKNHFIHLGKILERAGGFRPTFPTITIQDNPRDWFNDEQYAALISAIRKAIKAKVVVRYVPITEELLNLTTFMANTFLRPQDIKLLQNKHITVVKKPDRSYLRIMAKGKTAPAPVISAQAAVQIYEQHLKGKPEEYLFFNQYARSHAMGVMAKQFKYVLEKAGLYEGENGAERTLYSLRHTCIMNQLIHGKWSIHMLAKNCRTSVDMIERFYGSRLQAEMNVLQLHQQSEPGSTLEEFFEYETMQ
jgi:integrase